LPAPCRVRAIAALPPGALAEHPPLGGQDGEIRYPAGRTGYRASFMPSWLATNPSRA
jgi:hypothetical protein